MVADQVYYEMALRRLSDQIDQVDKLDGKTATCFVFAAAALPAFGALLALARQHPPHASLVVYGVSAVIYFAFLIVLLRSYNVRDWSFRPDLETLKTYSMQDADVETRLWVANECVLSIQANESIVHSKARAVRLALALLGCEALLLTTAAILALR